MKMPLVVFLYFLLFFFLLVSLQPAVLQGAQAALTEPSAEGGTSSSSSSSIAVAGKGDGLGSLDQSQQQQRQQEIEGREGGGSDKGEGSPAAFAAWEREEQQREEQQCSGGSWKQDFKAIHDRIRLPSTPAAERRYVTFTCVPGRCGGIGDLLIGLVSSFVIALVQRRALVVDYPWMTAAFVPTDLNPDLGVLNGTDDTFVSGSSSSSSSNGSSDRDRRNGSRGVGIDWRLGPDVPLKPLRRPPGTGVQRRRLRGAGVVVHVDLHNKDPPRADFAGYFDSLSGVGNIRLLWNRGVLVKLFSTTEESVVSGEDSVSMLEWRRVLEGKGLRLPSAFGCILRFLVRVRPDIYRMVEPQMRQLCDPAVAAIGIHVRTSDASTWNVAKVGEVPKLKKENLANVMKGAHRLFACAQTLEEFFYSPGVVVKWLLLSSSGTFKRAAADNYGESKVVVTSIPPVHIELQGSDEERTKAFRTTVAEWLLLSRCCRHFIFTESGFSKTAALHSLRRMSAYMFGRWADSWRDASWRDKCDPEEPTTLETLGNRTRWSGI